MAIHQKVLICNRGEIAIRIASSAAALGMESVSVFAPVDAMSLHTQVTDHAVPITSGRDGVNAYLDAETMIDIARAENCDCIHPGYGFLAEQPEFASLCADAGIAFIGPSANALALFGDKVAARNLARSLEIPVIEGGDEVLHDLADASRLAGQLGYPVMLKAAAGGGGRGMRLVQHAEGLADAFMRCGNEAMSAFADGRLFMEKLIVNPRHIEIQILADTDGHVMHLFERDCSVQQRHQKVIEIAPSPNLDDTIRQRLFTDAVKLIKGTDYVNAGTVEFLVVPETGEYYFIECNPRIQVEHTVTEAITGVDLIETQFQLAAGLTLESIIPPGQLQSGPKGFAIQSRVVARSNGNITAYREPSGAGIRVDGCGYTGYAPPPQFDPLLAKLICHVSRPGSDSFTSAARRSLRALSTFQIDGINTNLAQLQAILAEPVFQQGDARTTFLDLRPEIDNAEARSIDLFLPGGSNQTQSRAPLPGLHVQPGQVGVPCPTDSVIVELHVAEGQSVNEGDTLCVVTAMKMETHIDALCSGRIAGAVSMEVGQAVSADQVLFVIEPGDLSENTSSLQQAGWQPELDAVQILRELADARLAPDSEEPGVVRQRSRGKLTCRDRIEHLLDDGSFREVGSVAGFASIDEDGGISGFTPANSVGGWGQIKGRTAIVCADDFTSRGGHADGAIAAKSGYLDRLALEMKVPSVRLLDGSSGGGSVAAMVPQQKKTGESTARESTGAITSGRPRVSGGGGSFLPGHLGSSMYAEQLHTIPVVNLLLGSVVGIGAAKAVLGHFSVMVRDIAQLFVAGPPVVSHAMGYDITKEELGGWQVHCTNGSVDNLAESEEEAMEMARQFLSYLPASVFGAPPVSACMDPAGRREESLLKMIPRKRTTTFDIRRAIKLMADKDSFFEIGSLWGTDQVAGLARFNGHPVGIIASDSQHVNGGALTSKGCDKLKRHLDLCDLFHIPIVNLVDNPGFAVGLEHEIAGTIRKGGEWMIAFAQVSVPIFTVIMRRSFGVAGNNYATPRSQPAMRVVWPAADVGGIPPEGGIEAAYKRQLAEAEDPAALRAELNARIESARGPMGPLNKFQMEEMINPADTRRYVCEWIELAYQVTNQPGNLVSRDIQYRP